MTTDRPDATRAEGAPPAGALHVAIRRQLPAFVLDVAFDTGGGIVALVGPSGSGKTLTLRTIAGLLHADFGRIALGARTLFDAGARIDVPARERHIGYVFQHYALFPHHTAAQNIAYGLHTLPRDARDARVREMLALVRLDRHADKRPVALSGGEQQRVALARALAPQPSLLLLDEPLSALDAPLRRSLGLELRRLHRDTGIPMLLVTHDPDEARRVADVAIHLGDGRVVATHTTGTAPDGLSVQEGTS